MLEAARTLGAEADRLQYRAFVHLRDRHHRADLDRKESRDNAADFAIEARAQGAEPQEAIRQACLLRFRTIMMTTMAALFGVLPIAVGWGAGAELRQPLGLAVVGGLMVSQLLTLYITPAVHVLLEEFGTRIGAGRREVVPASDADRPEAAAPSAMSSAAE